MADEIATPEQLETIEALVTSWLAHELEENPVVAAVERDPTTRRWFVRIHGEEKDVYSLWLTVGQRTLQWETYFCPAPEENQVAFYEHLLRRNATFNGMAFWIGDEDALFLGGQLPLGAVDEGELDRILGETWVYVERCFRPAIRVGFASKFGDR